MELTNRHELICGILGRCAYDALRTARVAFQESSAVVNFAVDHEPWVLSLVVLPQLIDIDDLVNPIFRHFDLFHLLDCSMFRLFTSNLLAPVSVREIPTGLLDALHPATRHQSGLRRMLKSEYVVFLVNNYPEPWVVHHTQHTPVHISWLNAHRFVHHPHHDIIRLFQLGSANLQIPEAPAEARFAPVHVQPCAVQLSVFKGPVLVFCVIDLRKSPCLSLVER